MSAAHEFRADGDIGDETHWALLAKTHWLKPAKTRKVKPDVVKKDIWDALEEEGFNYRSLLQLEGLQLLERCTIQPAKEKYRCR